MNYNNFIKELLRKRGFETEMEMEQFLHPSLNSFHDPFLLNNMKNAVDRIRTAIDKKEKIVIYGDYDCDGICAVSILYLFLKSEGLSPIGFIPSRHTDGYGLSSITVNRIKEEFNPDLVITVDTGISARAEIAELNNLGIDTIVTDHHEPPAQLPDGIVVDPKISGQKYPFNGLSGAGVAFKLVQALSNLETALKYVDIACISTVGDIVPLLDENRIIVKLGLEKINSKNTRPSIAYLKTKLKVEKLNSTDIAFKIVPRLNACGRISLADKCFKYMISANGNELEQLYGEIEADNNLRLEMSAEIFKNIDEKLKSVDFNKEPAVFIRDDSINLGLIGIVASKLVNMLNRPVFIFSASDEGSLKCSVRSIDGIDIFKILDSHRDIMIDVGGHSLAGGLTIDPKNYEILKSRVNKDLKQIPLKTYITDENLEFDAEITEKDINLKLAMLVEELEPFGYMNPRPLFKLKTDSTDYIPMKSVKHYKIALSNQNEVISFFGDKLVPKFLNKGEKELIVSLEVDNFFSKPRAKALLKSISSVAKKFNDEDEYLVAKDIYYYSLIKDNNGSYKDIEPKYNPFGTIIITDKFSEALKISKDTNYKISLEPISSGESVVLYNPHRIVDEKMLNIYQSIIIKSGKNLVNYLRNQGFNVSDQTKEDKHSLSLSRDNFKESYMKVTKQLKQVGNNLFEIVENLKKKTSLTAEIIMATIMISLELNFYTIVEQDGIISLSVNTSSLKRKLDESKIFQNFK